MRFAVIMAGGTGRRLWPLSREDRPKQVLKLLDGETLLRTLLAWKRGEPRVCAMVVPPSPEQEDRRRTSREQWITSMPHKKTAANAQLYRQRLETIRGRRHAA